HQPEKEFQPREDNLDVARPCAGPDKGRAEGHARQRCQHGKKGNAFFEQQLRGAELYMKRPGWLRFAAGARDHSVPFGDTERRDSTPAPPPPGSRFRESVAVPCAPEFPQPPRY